MNEITNHAELTVERKKEGKYKRNRMLMWAGYFAVPVLVFAIFIILGAITGSDMTALGVFFIPIWAFLCPKVVYPLTFLYVDHEFKMDVSGGNLTLTQIFGKKKSKQLTQVKVSTMECVYPYNAHLQEGFDAQSADYKEKAAEFRKTADECKPDVRIECVSSMKNPDVYFSIFNDENDRKVLCFYEATNKAMKVFKFLNKNTFVTTLTR